MTSHSTSWGTCGNRAEVIDEIDFESQSPLLTIAPFSSATRCLHSELKTFTESHQDTGVVVEFRQQWQIDATFRESERDARPMRRQTRSHADSLNDTGEF